MNFFIFIVEKIKRIFKMATKSTKTTNDIKTKRNLIEIIQDIDFRLTHIEDTEADNRKLIVKLVQQGNTMIEFLKQFDIEELDPTELEMRLLPELPELPSPDDERMSRTVALKEIIDNIIERHQNLKEFEDELEKHKDKITPGQAGEA